MVSAALAAFVTFGYPEARIPHRIIRLYRRGFEMKFSPVEIKELIH